MPDTKLSDHSARGPAAGRKRASAEVPAREFDLRATLESGQVFHWTENSGAWWGCVGGEPARFCQRGGRLEVAGIDREAARDYLGLDDEPRRVFAAMPEHPFLARAFAHGGKMRILRQPLWECLGSFLLSPQKAVPQICRMSAALRERFGRPIRLLGRSLYAFPEPEVLAEAGVAALRECGLGYRARHLHATAEAVASGEFDLERLRGLADDAARENLQLLPGVGPKVAECVLLFGLGRLGAFPVDVWIERVLRSKFVGRRRLKAGALGSWARGWFGPRAGYAQQWLFHYARTVWRGED